MLKKFKPSFTTIMLWAGIAYLLFIGLYNSNKGFIYPVRYPISSNVGALRSDTCITYDEFKKSEAQKEEERQLKENLSYAEGGGIELAVIGIISTKDCDTCSSFGQISDNNQTKSYYLVLPGYRQTKQDSYFYTEQDKNFVNWLKPDYVYQDRSGKNQSFSSHYENKPLPYRFGLERKYAKERRGRVLIPISATTHKIGFVFIVIALISVIIAAMYFTFSLPVRLLFSISRGEVFTLYNIQKLRLLAWVLLLYPFSMVALRLLFRIIFYRYFTDDVELSVLPYLADNYTVVIIGLVVLIIAKAFQKGYSLQEEQDLTV